jgi:hypothetical protein
MEGTQKEIEYYNQQSDLEERVEELRRSEILETNWNATLQQLIINKQYLDVSFSLDWFDLQTGRREPLRFLDLFSLLIHLLITPTRWLSLFDTLVSSTMYSAPPPTKKSMDKVAELPSSIQQEMQFLNPPAPPAGNGLQFDFAPAAVATEKAVGMHGLHLCILCCFLRRMIEISFIGHDLVCLMKRYLCDLPKDNREKLTGTESV